MDQNGHSAKRVFAGGRGRRLGVAALLILAAGWAYWPALDRVFVADQLGYFSELHGETSLAAGLRLLDYGARRQYAKGDEASYRPLLFAELAVGNAVLKRDFRAWNAVNLAFHLAVAVLLFEVLRRRSSMALAAGFALWFALLAANFELVTWNHLGGYMLGYGLLLAALAAAREWADPAAGDGWGWFYGCAMLGAMLFHEIGVVAAFGGAAYVGWSQRRRPAARRLRGLLAAGAPIALYAALYARHATQCSRLFWVNAEGAAGSFLTRLAAVPVLMGRWAQHALLPRPDQLVVSALRRSTWLPVDFHSPWLWLAAALGAGTALFLARGFTRARCREAGPFALLLVGLVVVYAGLNLTGRPAYALTVPYYDYFPALLGAVAFVSLIDCGRVSPGARRGALACLLLLAALNGWQLRRIGERMQALNGPLARYLEWVEQGVRPRLAETGFSFAVRGAPPEFDLHGPLVFGYPDQGLTAEMPLLHFLYGKRYNSSTPAEMLVYPGPETPRRGPERGAAPPAD